MGEVLEIFKNEQLKDMRLEKIYSKIFISYKNETCNGEIKFYDEKKILSSRITLKDGCFHGLWEEFYKTGEIKEQKLYENGELNGEFKSYYTRNRLNISGEYKYGKETGEVKIYYENGNLNSIVNYENGVKEGRYKIYYENGAVKESGNFSNDEKNGMIETYHENSQLKCKVFVRDGSLEGEMKIYNISGELEMTGRMVRGRKNGLWKTYKNNKVIMTEEYIDSELNGEKKLYTENEELQLTEIYLTGKKIREIRTQKSQNCVLEDSYEIPKSKDYIDFRDMKVVNNLIIDAYRNLKKENIMKLVEKYRRLKMVYLTTENNKLVIENMKNLIEMTDQFVWTKKFAIFFSENEELGRELRKNLNICKKNFNITEI